MATTLNSLTQPFVALVAVRPDDRPLSDVFPDGGFDCRPLRVRDLDQESSPSATSGFLGDVEFEESENYGFVTGGCATLKSSSLALLLRYVGLVNQHNDVLVVITPADHLVLRQLEHVLENGGPDPKTSVRR